MPEGTIHIDQALTDVSIRFRNAEFVADQVYPVAPVEKQSNKYFVYGKENFRSRDDRRSPGSESHRARWSLSNDNYFCEGHSLKDFVPREQQANQDPALDLLIDTTEFLTEQIGLRREDNLVTQLVADMTGASLADITANKWDNNANNPISRIRQEKETIAKRVGVMPNVLVLSQPVFTGVRQNTNVTNLITGAQNLEQALVSAAQLADLLELDEVIVAKAVKDTANEGQAASLDWVWGKRALLFYRPRAMGKRTLALGATFRWRNALQSLGGQGVGAQFVERYYWQPNKADVVEVHDYYDLKTVSKDAGTLFINAVA